MKKYVVAFLFDMTRTRIALVKKNKPEWQAGSWNGIGGKLELGEEWLDCVSREFKEETGVDLPTETWEHTITLYNEWFECRFYRGFSDKVHEVKTMETEKIEVFPTISVPRLKTIPNLSWLVPMMLDAGLNFPVAPIKDG
jgi:8-oxo-dGTP diphosphatase